MDALKAQLDRVREQMAALTGSQRMLVGTLVAVMAMTLAYWGRYAGTQDMVPVLDQTLSEEEMGPINRQLDASNVTHSVVNGRVMVPADRKQEVLANLMFNQALPSDTHSAFEEMSSKNLNWFSSQSERDAVYNHATELQLAAVIRRWPGVSDARVVINNKSERHIGESVLPSAMVDVRTRSGSDATPIKQLVQAAADGVAGAVSGLTTDHIKVIVNGRSTHVPTASADAGGGTDVTSMIELRERTEASLEQKVHAQFAYIPELTVAVTCDIDTQTRVSDVHKFDKATSFVQPLNEHTTSGEQHGTDAGSREPGAATNDGLDGPGGGNAAASGGGTSTSTTTSDEQTQNQVFAPDEVQHIITPAGKTTVLSAAVSIPMSYIAREFRATHPSVKDPTDADLQQASVAEVARVRQKVAGVVGLSPTADRLSVDTFADGQNLADLTLAAAAGPAVSTSAAALGGLAVHAKEIGVGVLAVVSLAMMFQMARKSNVALPIGQMPSLAGMGMPSMSYGGGGDDDDEGDERPTPTVSQAEMLVGGMEGMELDADTLRTQQMLDQVSTLVKEDPDAAAALVKRWVSRA